MKTIIGILLLIFSSISVARPIRGTYEVPTSSELRPYAIFPVKLDAKEYFDAGATTLTFPLPNELSGEINYIKMERSGRNSNVWSGPQVIAHCGIEERNFICTMKFNNLVINPDKILEVLAAKFSNPTDIAASFQVSSLFGEEAGGILKYRLRARDSQY